MLNNAHSVNVYFFQGATGTGKTTFAKHFCKENNLSLCITGSSNDPLQDYQGEDVLLLDDARDSTFSYTDLLKILDNHTRTSIRSRYNNKFFYGKIIIVTSYKPLHEWYSSRQDGDGDGLQQLYRRITSVFEFHHDYIIKFDREKDEFNHYILRQVRTIPNQIKDMFVDDNGPDPLGLFFDKMTLVNPVKK